MDNLKSNVNNNPMVDTKKLNKKNSAKVIEKTQYISEKCNTIGNNTQN